MCKGIFSKIKSLFTKNNGALLDIDVNVTTKKNKNQKSKKLRYSIDNSDDHSTNVNGDYNYKSSINYYGEMQTKDLIVIARWNKLVPHEVIHCNNGLDKIRALQAIDGDFLPAQLEINYDNSSNQENAIYFLIKHNNFIKNLYIKTLKFDFIELTTPQDLFALLNGDRSFIVVHNKFKIKSGILTIVLGFEQDNGKFYQEFIFKVSNDSSEFILQKYNYPTYDIDLSCFKSKD